MKESYERALRHVLIYEGKYSDHPSDPGGATNLGITIAVLAAWRGRAVTKADVRALTLDEAAAIYKARYWDNARCDDLPAGLDLAAFDCAVNQGVGRAARLLQQAAGATVDGVLGPKTLSAVRAGDARLILLEFMARRMQGYGSLQKLFRVFGLGWSRRLMATNALALELLKDAEFQGNQGQLPIS